MSYDLSLLGSVGRNVTIHESVIIFNPQQVHIGDDVRIDCMSMISAGAEGVHIGRHVHIAAMVQIFGSAARVTLGDFVGLSSRTTVYSATDDFSGETLTGPTVPMEFRGVRTGAVDIGRHVIVGCGTVILPGVTIGTGGAVGALSLVDRDVAEFTIVAGTPCRPIGERSRRLLELEQRLPHPR